MLLGFALAGCAPRDPWPGNYAGEVTTDGRDCTTGERIEDPATNDVTVNVLRTSAGKLVIHGRCLFELEELSSSAARFEPVSCDTTLSDGTAAHIEVVNGGVALNGNELRFNYALDVMTRDWCLTATSSFVGYRN